MSFFRGMLKKPNKTNTNPNNFQQRRCETVNPHNHKAQPWPLISQLYSQKLVPQTSFQHQLKEKNPQVLYLRKSKRYREEGYESLVLLDCCSESLQNSTSPFRGHFLPLCLHQAQGSSAGQLGHTVGSTCTIVLYSILKHFLKAPCYFQALQGMQLKTDRQVKLIS